MKNSVLGDRRIVFIGVGNMAEALVRGLLDSGTCRVGQLRVADIRPERLAYFADTYGVDGTASNADAASAADVIVLAVKPQVVGEALAGLRGALDPAALVISIAAGIAAARIEQGLGGTPRVIRVMPNTPSLVGAGAAAIAPGTHAGEEDLALAECLMAAVGIVERVAEADLDAVTALSGSGPAYVFYLVEALLAAASELALDPGVARRLAVATVAGAARLLGETGEDPAELRRRVTSKGGTTEAAIAVFDAREVRTAVVAALRAARDRSREFSRSTP